MCSIPQEDRGVCFRDDQGARDGKDSGEDGNKGGHPSPTSSFPEKATDLRLSVGTSCKDRPAHDWSQSWPEEWCGSEDRHSKSSLSCTENIANGTAGVCQWARSGCTGEESQDDQSPDVLARDDSSVECGEQDVGEDEQIPPAEDFGQWCPEQRTEHKSEHKCGCDHDVDLGCIALKCFFYRSGCSGPSENESECAVPRMVARLDVQCGRRHGHCECGNSH